MNRTQKKVENEHKKSKNGVTFENEVKEILDKKHHISKPRLKADLLKVHKGELGYSEKTIDRKLYQMEKNGDLTRLKYDDYPIHGITEKNKRAVYYVSKKYLKIKEDLDKIFAYIEFDDPVAQKLAFEEIIRHDEEYLFNTHQLDILASRLGSKDNKFISDILNTLCEYILGRGIEPSDENKKNELLKTLRELLGRCKIGSLEYPNVKEHILWLLGHYKDSAVIEQLKEDAESKDPTMMLAKYCNEHVAPLIEENLLELFDLQFKLRQEGKEKASEFISQIKNYAYDPQKLKTLDRDEELPKKIQKFRRERTK